jgi:type IV pilus assembly protein PilO
MAKLNELPLMAKVGIVAGVFVLLTVGAYFGLYQALDLQNREMQAAVDTITQENQTLKQFENRMPDLERQIGSLKQQLEIQKRIVPDEREADQFMRLMQTEAAQAGIEIRRYTARPVSTKDYYAEVPFEMELDGPFFGVVNFFERVANLERIIKVTSIRMASVREPRNARPKKVYKYPPSQTVVATCLTTTFFSVEPQAPPPEEDAKAKKGRPGRRKPAAPPAKG